MGVFYRTHSVMVLVARLSFQCCGFSAIQSR